ncbi:hypothetical protein BDQ94DRAFT_154882 [Aspergillus welwitschiae]|uniref:Uncharacterized protein n=1 Tax=Aspergillus welwitschiae TaxID=1341132 RepID=A0A3F3PIW2_9EURO|nr:hypothetical protein BDQ94DRAFT_154882 [Aspergillus welwitschiae]RDH26869.1 hypothetical protein BDQ94DRAFT_154882 [Aspergillus welwitschiae]
MADASGSSNAAYRTDDLDGELQYYKDLLERLLSFIRHADREDIFQVISVIRSNASNERIFSAISEAMEVNGDTNNDGMTKG